MPNTAHFLPGVKKSSPGEVSKFHDGQSRSPTGLRQAFPGLIPLRPYCSNDLERGVVVRPSAEALRYRHIQLNHPSSAQWITFDYDHPGGYFADDDANLPPANIVAINPENGRAHLSYLLESPVATHDMARLEPLKYLAAVQCGMTKRMGADQHYVGLITKNPLHSDWHVEWRRERPYSLDELDDALFPADKRKESRRDASFGFGRNVTAFECLRTIGYREVLKLKADGLRQRDFDQRLLDIVTGINMQFAKPMSPSELRAISKSVSKWTWRRFSDEGRSRWASRKGKKGNAKRWAGHNAAEQTKPWEALNMSRASYYRKGGGKALLSDIATVSYV
jgi:hypothetical protein